MIRRTLALALVLIGLGLGSYFGSGMTSPTALIPTLLGLAVGMSGWFALRSARSGRWQAVAMTIAALGLLGTLRGLARLPELLSGADVASPTAIAVQSAVAILCALFIGFEALGARAGHRKGRRRAFEGV